MRQCAYTRTHTRARSTDAPSSRARCWAVTLSYPIVSLTRRMVLEDREPPRHGSHGDLVLAIPVKVVETQRAVQHASVKFCRHKAAQPYLPQHLYTL
ncbi:MAG: hypothetical protein ACK55Z_08890 [bacterium]